MGYGIRIATLLALACATPAVAAAPHAAPSPHAASSPQAVSAKAGLYADYAFLVGEWDVRGHGGPPVAVVRFQWGPNQSYLWYSLAMLQDGHEQPHLEGLLLWNGARRNLDILLTLDLEGGRAQEQGVVSIRPDGTVVKEVTGIYSEGEPFPPGFDKAGAHGATARFRQTFRAAGPDTVVTAAMREAKDGWVPTFPGSDRLVMTRRAKG